MAPWVVSAQALPPPTWAQSIEIIEEGAPVVWAPGENPRRRGTVKRGTRIAVAGRVFGPGCPAGSWFVTKTGHYVCESHARPSDQPPGGIAQPHLKDGQSLPFDYAFIQYDGTRAFAHPNDYFADQYVEAMGEGFGIVVSGFKDYEGIPFVRTRGHLWVERDQIAFARGTRFSGVQLAGAKRIGWSRKNGTRVVAKPKGRVTRRLGRREVIEVAGLQDKWVRLVDGGWVHRSDVALMSVQAPPASTKEGERWIDIDIAEQVLVAYEGRTPVFATLVSTGKKRKTHATPLGEHRIWVKLAYSDMDDISRTDVARNYSIQNVPWVQYFEGANGLHAAFWHNDFGRRRSHGCVNLAPADARFLFSFTKPALPDGWHALLTTEADRPTMIRVR